MIGTLYLALAGLGLAATWYWNVQHIIAQAPGTSLGDSIAAFLRDAYANPASSSLTNDIGVVALAFVVWSFFEARRLQMPRWWLYPFLTFGVAAAFAVPLFLWQREGYVGSTPHRPSGT